MHKIILILSIITFFGCEPLEVDEVERDVAPQIGDEAWESKALTVEEIQTARKFCRALESKEVAFRRDYIGQYINFNVQYRNCDGQRLVDTLRARLQENLSSRSLEFYLPLPPLPFWSEVQVQRGQVLGDFCVDLLSNLQVSNTVVQESEKSIFKFTSFENVLRVQVQRLHIDDENVSTLEEISIEAQGTASRPKGMVIDRTYLRACEDDSDSSNSYLRRQSL